jgi:hypothetical protein
MSTEPECECGEPKSAGIHDAIRTWVNDPSRLHAFAEAENGPRTEAGQTMLRDPLYRHAIGHVLAIEEQAAAEARRELLAKVEALRIARPAPEETQWNAALLAVRRLIKDRP